MKRVKFILLLIIMLILQGTAAGLLSVRGAVPDLILMTAAALTFSDGSYEYIAGGTLAALLQDICYGPIVGISALMTLLSLLLVYAARERLYADNLLAQLIAAAAVTFVYHTGYWAGSAVLLISGIPYLSILKILPVTMLWNTLFFMAAVRLAGRGKDRYFR